MWLTVSFRWLGVWQFFALAVPSVSSAQQQAVTLVFSCLFSVALWSRFFGTPFRADPRALFRRIRETALRPVEKMTKIDTGEYQIVITMVLALYFLVVVVLSLVCTLPVAALVLVTRAVARLSGVDNAADLQIVSSL